MTSTSRRRVALVLATAAGLLTSVAVPAASSPGGGPQRDADAIHALGVVGVQAEITDRHGSVVVTSGHARVDAPTPMPPDGRFRIASTRKAFVATVVLQLVGEHRLSLDDPVERWLPGVVRGNGNDGRRITVRHLLQNTSGIHDDLPGYTTPAEYLQQRYDVHSRDELIARAMRHRPDFAPGTGWGYSNTGFLLLDAIVERVTGRPLREVVDARIVRPLGLRTVTWPGTSPALPEPHPQAYQLFPGGELVDITEQVSSDPDGVVAGTRDLTVFFRALLGGRLLRPAELAAMRHTVPVGPDLAAIMPDAGYGLGLIRRPLPCGGVYWGHDGGDGGFITVTGVTPSGDRSVVVTMSTALGDSFDHLVRQQHAADTLVTNALCRRG